MSDSRLQAPPQKAIEAALEFWLHRASARQTADGLSWYANARTFARIVSIRYTVPFETVCGVIAALSPAVYWELNKAQAEAMIAGNTDVVPSTYGKQVYKARRILRGTGVASPYEIKKVLGRRAFKTWAFFENIRNPQSSDVTIDQHMIDAVEFGHWVQSARWCYDLMVRAVQAVAGKHSLRGYEVQAIVWVTHAEATATRERPLTALEKTRYLPF